ncbi:MAG: hypothetical protein EXR69_02175 [Myxococcales bacterium]|nr:hypothetical protein [Myxococcales bacterium]
MAPRDAPRVAWTRSDLRRSASTEKRPFTLSARSTRLRVLTKSGVVTLDARTGDTLSVHPAAGADGDTFRNASVDLPGEGRREGRGGYNGQRLAVGGARRTLSYRVNDDPARQRGRPENRQRLGGHANARMRRRRHRHRDGRRRPARVLGEPLAR